MRTVTSLSCPLPRSPPRPAHYLVAAAVARVVDRGELGFGNSTSSRGSRGGGSRPALVGLGVEGSDAGSDAGNTSSRPLPCVPAERRRLPGRRRGWTAHLPCAAWTRSAHHDEDGCDLDAGAGDRGCATRDAAMLMRRRRGRPSQHGLPPELGRQREQRQRQARDGLHHRLQLDFRRPSSGGRGAREHRPVPGQEAVLPPAGAGSTAHQAAGAMPAEVMLDVRRLRPRRGRIAAVEAQLRR